MEKTLDLKLKKIRSLKCQYLLNKHIKYALLKNQCGYKDMNITEIQQALIKPKISKFKPLPVIRDVFNTSEGEGPIFSSSHNHAMIARLYSHSKFK